MLFLFALDAGGDVIRSRNAANNNNDVEIQPKTDKTKPATTGSTTFYNRQFIKISDEFCNGISTR